jgi:hypothetical protein
MSHAMGWWENLIAQIAETRTIAAKIPILLFMPAMLSRCYKADKLFQRPYVNRSIAGRVGTDKHS